MESRRNPSPVGILLAAGARAFTEVIHSQFREKNHERSLPEALEHHYLLNQLMEAPEIKKLYGSKEEKAVLRNILQQINTEGLQRGVTLHGHNGTKCANGIKA